jgi:hypothetical protein
MNDGAAAESWQPQFQVNGCWVGNGYRFTTEEAALVCAESFAARWALRGKNIGQARAVRTSDPPNKEDW